MMRDDGESVKHNDRRLSPCRVYNDGGIVEHDEEMDERKKNQHRQLRLSE